MKKFLAGIKNLIKKKYMVISLLIVAVVFVGVFAYSKKQSKEASKSESLASAVVSRGDISVTISGSGTVEPISRYEIISLVRGEIIESKFEEGDHVKEGDILYRIDSTDLQNSIQKQYNNIEKLQLTAKNNADNIANLKVRAPASGTLTDFNVKVDDSVGTGKVATIVNNRELTATVPFNSSQIGKIKVGDRATVTSALYMASIEGTVSYVSNVTASSTDGSTLYDVEISLRNPGSLASGTSVGATIHTSSGDVKSPISGKIENSEVVSVIPKVSGKVVKVNVRNNQFVNKGDILFEIDDADYLQAQKRTNLELQDMQLSLESQYKELENYNIKSPIDGVVISKTYKAGDTIGSSQNSSASLMTVADTSKMVFNLDVDELEISKVSVGLKATITADALPGETFEGVVTKVAKEGTSQNGVTTYSVELTINEPRTLMSGMNVNAEIIVEESKDTLLVPVAAVSNIRNGQGFVLMKTDEAPQRQAEQGDGAFGGEGNSRREAAPRPEGSPSGERGTGGEGMPPRQRGESQQAPQGRPNASSQPENTQKPEDSASSAHTSSPAPSSSPEQNSERRQGWQVPRNMAPEGYAYVRVAVGLSGTDNIEIIDGLSEGDTIYYAAGSSSAMQRGQSMQMRGMGGMGGAHMGGAPMGGMSRPAAGGGMRR